MRGRAQGLCRPPVRRGEAAMTTVIDGKVLDQFQVAPDGASVQLGLRDRAGRPVAERLPVECLNALMMTLPGMLAQALRAQHRDSSLRMVFPVGEWSVESAAAGDLLILTLGTPDGFKVSFGIRSAELAAIGGAAERGEDAVRLATN
jgi:hypothetical protein